MMGFARKDAMTSPCTAVTIPPNASAPMSAGAKPTALSIVTNTNDVAAAVAPRANDIIVPPRVMKVIPAAMQPITDAVLISAVKLGIDRKLGVRIAHASSTVSTIARVAAIGV